ncbi:Homeodomain-like protein, partial [Tribonema minus]
EEDDLLTALVAQHGLKKWAEIAKHIPGRSNTQCRERWLNQLDPKISKRKWTTDDEEELYKAHAALGPQWAQIAKQLPGRSTLAVKNRVNS